MQRVPFAAFGPSRSEYEWAQHLRRARKAGVRVELDDDIGETSPKLP